MQNIIRYFILTSIQTTHQTMFQLFYNKQPPNKLLIYLLQICFIFWNLEIQKI